jgi:transposase
LTEASKVGRSVLLEGEAPVMPSRKYPKELIDRGVRLAIESDRPVSHVAAELGLPAETLRKKVREAEADQGLRPDLPSTAEREQIKELKREVAELRRANEILRAASLFFANELDESRPR